MAWHVLPVFTFLVIVHQSLGQVNPCNKTNCVPKTCYCPTTKIPLAGDLNQIPQMVLLTFNGPLDSKHGKIIEKLFLRRIRNPNGTPIRATLFVSDNTEDTDYCTVKKLWAVGHEIATLSVSQSYPSKNWWKTANQKDWEKEIEHEKEYIVENSSIPFGDIRGFRNPYLQPGGDEQYKFAIDKDYLFDSTIRLPLLTPPIWPYTMDFPSNITCQEEPCPRGKFPGLWQIPIQPLQDTIGEPCIYLDKCDHKPTNAHEMYLMLWKNFNVSFHVNRAPMMINLLNYKKWFDNNPWAMEGLQMFIEKVTSYDDEQVWFVTYTDLIGWMMDPSPISNIRNFGPFSRRKQPPPKCLEKAYLIARGGPWILLAEFIICVVSYLYLYYKDRHPSSAQ